MIVTRKHLPRRTFLRGVGAAIALPFLDAMSPAFAGPASAGSAPVRMAFCYVPNGIVMKHWTPQVAGEDFDFPRILKSMEPFREDLLILTGLAHRNAEGGNGDHARAGGTYLTGVRPRRTAGSLRLGISVDQVAASTIGIQTRLPSLELGCEATPMIGSCDAGYNCAYQNSMSWSSASTPMPPETNPRLVFERLYGSSGRSVDPKTRAERMEDRKSVLDRVTEKTRRLLAALGPSDAAKIDEYYTAIRAVERQMARADAEGALTPGMEQPAGIPETFVDHVQLMQDLMALAFQADITRVSTLMYAREGSGRAYPELGFTDGHHPITHHRHNPELIEKVTQINTHHVAQFSKFVRKLKSIQDGDGTLLDHSMIVYGSSLSDGNNHVHENLPVMLAGRGDGSIKPGRHIVYPETPMTNLYLTMLDRMGVPAERLGDSTGKIEQLSQI